MTRPIEARGGKANTDFGSREGKRAERMAKRRPIIFTVTAIIVLTQIGFAQKEIPMLTEKGTVTLIFNGFSQETPAVSGMQAVRLQASIRNDTPFTFAGLMFELNGYDASGNDVKECGIGGAGGGCRFNLFDPIKPGQTLPLKAPGDFAVIQTSRNVVRVELKVIEATYFIKYEVQSDPVANQTFTISPSFGLKGIGLEFRNKSSDVIEVAWDQSVYIDEHGNSSRLIRGNVNLAEKDRSQPNTVIPPGTKLQETVFPVDRVQQVDGKWTQVPILPELAYIFDEQFLREQAWARAAYRPGTKNFTGEEVRLFLRLLVNEQKQNVTITFKIANMIQ